MRQLFSSPRFKRVIIDVIALSGGTAFVMCVAKVVSIYLVARSEIGSEWLGREASWVSVASWFFADIWVGTVWGMVLGAVCAGVRELGGRRAAVMTITAVLQASLGVYLAASLYVYDLFGVPPSWPLLQALQGAGAARDSVVAFVGPGAIAILLMFAGALIASPWLFGRAMRDRPALRIGVVAALASLLAVAGIASASAGHSPLALDRNAVLEFAESLWFSSGEPEQAATDGEFGRALEPVADRTDSEPPLAGYLRIRRWAINQRPNVVVIVMESTAIRHMSLMGSDVANTPTLDRLANRGLLWSRHYSHTPRSMNSLYSILCAQHPRPFAKPMTQLRPRIACASASEVLAETGYGAALFHSGTFHYSRKMRFFDDRRYRVLLDALTLPGSGTRYKRWSWGVEEQAAVDALLEWVANAERPFFVTYIPVYPHHPYHVPDSAYERFTGKGRESDYENAVYYVDQMIDQIVRGFEQLDLADNTLFVIVGDHGEAFGEHPGSKVHGGKLYDEQVRTFVLWSAPGALRGRFEDHRVTGHVDLLPTLLDLLGLPAQPQHPSSSVANRHPRPMVPLYSPHGFPYLGLVDGRWKFIYDTKANQAELYDLRSDPDERSSVASRYPGLVRSYNRRLREFRGARNTWEKSLPNVAARRSPAPPLGAVARWTFDPAACDYPADHFAVRDGQLRMVKKARRASVRCAVDLPPIRGRVTGLSVEGIAAVKQANVVVTLAWEATDGSRKLVASSGFAGTPKRPRRQRNAELVADTSFGRGGQLIAELTYKFRGSAKNLSYETFRIDALKMTFEHDGRWISKVGESARSFLDP